MPPKAEITKEKVLEAAFEIVRAHGLEALTARSIAQKLKCSTQPIYSVYGNMVELKDDVYDKAVSFANARMSEYEDEKNVLALNNAIGCLYFAKNEKQLFKTVYLSGYRKFDSKDKLLNVESFISFLHMEHNTSQTAVPESTLSKIFLKLSIYLIGIGSMINTDTLDLDINEAAEMMIEMYEALLLKADQEVLSKVARDE
ncbi:TetR/AcrR family transcriptional regulator [Paenibacillus psychroresistens]|uniref:TetR/AcrR family transcriptional regulator n=1 Tax=Paenibacillus psychroresistens TaxID=1778678 RepID=A0A6B8RFL9_9BACL|nr:TetR/AcrR family transcriptional regulator [Paenibacillus psychroresistens]QGQ94218.1 TetR/AcrR family transcriptional regulator [Paenibacillus psychroresistens]